MSTFTRRVSDQLTAYPDLAKLFGKTPAELKKEVWLFAVPHDDDVAIGGGLWLKAAIDAGVQVHLLAATDGRMGYCAPEEKADIVKVRAKEMVDSSRILGVTDPARIHFLGFPDCSLSLYLGRRAIKPGEHDFEGGTGYTGLQGAFVKKLREIKPTRLIMPSPMDYHPDHQIVYNEMMICIFHAGGGVWPELGPSCAVPEVYEMAIYCDFPSPPTLQLKCDEKTFQAKLDCIAAFKSQKQIGALVEKVRGAGPYEYLREVGFSFYDANNYHSLFAGQAIGEPEEISDEEFEDEFGSVEDEFMDAIMGIASEVAGQVAEAVAHKVIGGKKAKKAEKKAKKAAKATAKKVVKKAAVKKKVVKKKVVGKKGK